MTMSHHRKWHATRAERRSTRCRRDHVAGGTVCSGAELRTSGSRRPRTRRGRSITTRGKHPRLQMPGPSRLRPPPSQPARPRTRSRRTSGSGVRWRRTGTRISTSGWLPSWQPVSTRRASSAPPWTAVGLRSSPGDWSSASAIRRAGNNSWTATRTSGRSNGCRTYSAPGRKPNCGSGTQKASPPCSLRRRQRSSIRSMKPEPSEPDPRGGAEGASAFGASESIFPFQAR